jgi:hypothetical protein
MPTTKAGPLEFTELDQAYRLAFRDWNSQLHNFQTVSEHPIDDAETRKARELAAAAESAYREKRDRLAGFILTGTRLSRIFGPYDPTVSHQTLTPDQYRDVEVLAYRYWEEAGRPHGTAEADWLRAEKVVLSRTN